MSLKLRVDRATLADAANWVGQAISRRPATPELGGIRLAGEGSTLTLSAYDYSAAHTATISAEVVSDGEALVSGVTFRSLVAAIKGREVELALDGQRLTVQSGRSTYRLGVMRVEDYPHMPPFPAKVGTLDAEDLATLVGTVEHAAARNDHTVPILEAVNLASDGATLVAFTTDRFRIARAEAAISDGEAFTVNVVAASIAASLKGMTGAVELGHEGGQFGIRDAHRSVVVRIVEAEHVRPDAFFSMAPTVSVEVDARDLAEALKRTALVGDNFARVLLTVGRDEISLSADSESAEGVEIVECDADGEIEALFNGVLLGECLLAVAPDRARLTFVSPTKPVTIRPADADSPAAVVMPRRKTT